MEGEKRCTVKGPKWTKTVKEQKELSKKAQEKAALITPGWGGGNGGKAF